MNYKHVSFFAKYLIYNKDELVSKLTWHPKNIHFRPFRVGGLENSKRFNGLVLKTCLQFWEGKFCGTGQPINQLRHDSLPPQKCEWKKSGPDQNRVWLKSKWLPKLHNPVFKSSKMQLDSCFLFLLLLLQNSNSKDYYCRLKNLEIHLSRL